MTTISFVHFRQTVHSVIVMIRRALLPGALVPLMIVSLTGCNGTVFSSLFEDTYQKTTAASMLALLLSGQSTIPDIKSITSATPNGTYGIGSSINISVRFNTPVLLSGGQLYVRLDARTGGVDVPVSAASYPSNTFNGTYIVAAGDNSGISPDANPLLDSIAVFLDAGATLTDKKGTPAILAAEKSLIANKSITIDGIPPALSFMSTPIIYRGNESDYSLSGSCSENGRTVLVTIGGAVNTTVVCMAGLFNATSLDVSAIPDSTSVTINASQTDSAGNDYQVSAMIVKNSAKPTVEINPPSLINNSNKTNYSISGTCTEDGRRVDINIGSGAVTSQAVCNSGTFTAVAMDVSGILDGPSITITADHSDAFGNTADPARATTRKDTINPAIGLTAPSVINNANKTDYTISGTCSEDGRPVIVNAGGVTATPTCGGGTFITGSMDLHALGEGSVSITADLTDAAGNTAPQASAGTIKDTMDPAITFTSAPPINTANQGSYTVSGTCSENGRTVTVSIGGVTATPSCGGGTFSTASMDVHALGDGSVVITANQTDTAGNTGLGSASVAKDTIVPTVSIGPPSATIVSHSGSITYGVTYAGADAIHLTAARITLNTTGGASCTRAVIDGTTANPTVTLSNCTGNGEIGISIAAGASSDAAGNADTGAGPGAMFSVDTTAPVVSINAPSPGTAVNGTETIIFSDSDSGPQVSVNGSVWVTAASGSTRLQDITGFPGLGQGTMTLYLRDTDAAGNTGSDSVTLNKDTAGPVILSAETGDSNKNMAEYPNHVLGRIDFYKITFNKPVNDSTFGTSFAENGVGGPQTEWIVQNHSNVRLVHGTAAAAELGVVDTPNDEVIFLKFDEGSGYDTGTVPNLFTSSPEGPGLKDMIGTSGNAMTQVVSGTLAGSNRLFDKAPPVIVSFTGSTGKTAASIAFSEPVKSGTGGRCDLNPLTRSNFGSYDNGGAGGATDFTISTGTACDGIVDITLNNPLLVTDLNNDKITVVSGTSVYDAYDNPASASIEVAATGAISPYVLFVEASATNKIRITYSEPVDNSTEANGARNWNNYTFAPAANTYNCNSPSQGTNDAALDTAGEIIEVQSFTVFELPLTADLCSSTTYTLTVSGPVLDSTYHVALSTPDYGSFQGYEKLKISSASSLTTTSFVVTFNKAVVAGSGNPNVNADNTANFKVTGYGTSDIGSLSAAMRQINDHRFINISHSLAQRKRMYTVIGANGLDNGDGFPNAASIKIQAEGISPSEYLQPQPDDRTSWQGQGQGVDSFSDGPIAEDPFGDASTFGYLSSYNSQIYIGPNKFGNSATRFNADGSNPANCDFTFDRDTTNAGGTSQSNTSSNYAGTRDGGIAVPPYVTIGHTGCTRSGVDSAHSADLAVGCGPNDEDGRGLFINGTINGTEYLFITGGRTLGTDDYLYYTTSTDVHLNFHYLDLYNTLTRYNTVGGNRNTEGIIIFSDRLYWLEPGVLSNRPYFTKVLNLATQDAMDGVNSVFMYARYLPGIGSANATKPNYADSTGGTLYSFNDELYLANSGSVRNTSDNTYTNVKRGCSQSSAAREQCRNDGGIVRSTNVNGFGSNPRGCNPATGACDDWTDITPSSTDFTNYFSILAAVLADTTPADRPFPSFAAFNGRLYMLRNACTVNMYAANQGDGNCINPLTTTNQCTDDRSCTASGGVEVPQLWKCDPAVSGSPTECDPDDWSLVAQHGTTGKTNFGSDHNTHITLLAANGPDNLYIGFDNGTDGVRLFTSSGANRRNPSSESDFVQVPSTNGDSFGIKTCGSGSDPCYTKLYSSISLPAGSNYYLYVSGGNNAGPVAVFRQKD